MSTDRAALFAACLNEPADDTARLVYADFLREQDDPVTQAIGRFVWAGVTLAGFRGHEPVGDGMFFDAQRELNAVAPTVLAAQLGHLLGWKWEHTGWDQGIEHPDRVTGGVIPPATGAPRRVLSQMRRTRANAGPGVLYERGMLTAVRLPLAEWLGHASGLLAAAPLQRVDVLDVPGLSLHVIGPDNGWVLAGELQLPPTVEQLRRRGLIGPTAPTPQPLPGPMPKAMAQGKSRSHLTEAARRFSIGICRSLWAAAGDEWPGPPLDDLLSNEWPESAA
jgi:uncharacterized protein (TIGR02996 family)